MGHRTPYGNTNRGDRTQGPRGTRELTTPPSFSHAPLHFCCPERGSGTAAAKPRCPSERAIRVRDTKGCAAGRGGHGAERERRGAGGVVHHVQEDIFEREDERLVELVVWQ